MVDALGLRFVLVPVFLGTMALVILATIAHVERGDRLRRLPIAIAGGVLLGLGGLGLLRSLAFLRNPGPIYEAQFAGAFFTILSLGLILLSHLVMWIAFIDVTRALRQLASETANAALARLLEWPQAQIIALTSTLPAGYQGNERCLSASSTTSSTCSQTVVMSM